MATWDLQGMQHHVLICNGGTCQEHGADAVTEAIRAAIREAGADEHIHTTRTRCNGRCNDACVVIAYPTGRWYRNMHERDARSWVQQLLSSTPDDPTMDTQCTYFVDHYQRLQPTGHATTRGERKNIQ